MRQREYRARVVEGERGFRIYLRESDVDALIAAAERLDPKIKANARVLQDIKIISQTEYTPAEERAFVARAIERLLLTKIGK